MVADGRENMDAPNEQKMLVCDLGALTQAMRDELGDQVRFVLSLDPKSPSIAFTVPDCGSEELGYKTRHLGAIVLSLTELVFKWTTSDNYDVEEGEDHDPSIA